jgi:hypothetical protein
MESMFASPGIDVSSCLEHLSIMQSGEAIARLVEGQASVAVAPRFCWRHIIATTKWAVPLSLGGEAWAGVQKEG